MFYERSKLRLMLRVDNHHHNNNSIAQKVSHVVTSHTPYYCTFSNSPPRYPVQRHDPLPPRPSQPVKWSKIALLIPGRLGKQCRERWFNHLDPSLTKTMWTDREDEILFNALVRTTRFGFIGLRRVFAGGSTHALFFSSLVFT